MLEFTIRQADASTHIAMQGALTSDALANLRATLKEVVSSGGLIITIDMAGVSAIDSGGVGLLAALHNTLSTKGGKLEITELNHDLYSFFTDMRLHTHFKIAAKK